MADVTFLSYVGAAAGGIGALTGIAGAIMGYVSFRRVGELKKLDLRLDLRKAAAKTRLSIDALPSLLERANRSRAAVGTAAGHGPGSGSMTVWAKAFEEDNAKVDGLRESRPEVADYATHAPEDLETELVRVHSLQLVVEGLSAKYLATMTEDDRTREQIRASAQAFALRPRN